MTTSTSAAWASSSKVQVTSAPSAVSSARRAGVAAGGDHLGGAEPLGDLDRHPAGVAGRAEDQDALPALEVDAAAQRDPRRHHRVHRGGDLHGVDAVGQDDAAVEVDDGALGHRAERRVVEDRVAQAAVGVADDAVDAGDERELVGAGVVRAIRLGADPRVQAGGEHLNDHLVAAAGDGLGVVAVAGRGIERGDDCGVHGDLRRIVVIQTIV